MNDETTDGRKRVLVIGPDESLARALAGIVEEAGYDVRISGRDEDPLEASRSYRPDALIVDSPGTIQGLQLLDALRSDHLASQAPVLVLARSKDMRRRSLASYNVRKVITKPFDPEELVDKLREVMGQPPLHAEIPPDATHDGIVGMAEYLLARYSRSAVLQLLQRLREESPWRDREDLDFKELLDVTPVIVEALVAALHYADPTRYFRDHPEAIKRVGKHGSMRASQGIPLPAVLREHSLLRDEIWAALWSQLPRSINTPDVINLQRVVNGTLDFILEQTVAQYLQQKGYRPPLDRSSALDDLSDDVAEGPRKARQNRAPSRKN